MNVEKIDKKHWLNAETNIWKISDKTTHDNNISYKFSICSRFDVKGKYDEN